MNIIPINADKPFEGLAAGVWIDMAGRSVEIDAEKFPLIVENTMKAIGSTSVDSGDVVGLPIDQRNHNKGEAAGHIVSVELGESGKIELTPRWNDAGRKLIGGNIFRCFSATFDPANNVILGGSLVNWPALVNRDGTRALKPIELGSMLIAHSEKTGKNIMEFTAEDRDTALAEFMSSQSSGSDDDETGEINMDKDELIELIGAVFDAKLKESAKRRLAEFGKGDDSDKDGDAERNNLDLDMGLLFDFEGASDELMDAYKEKYAEFGKLVESKAKASHIRMMAQVRREHNVAEFVTKITTGNADRPRALATDADKLGKWLLSLNAEQAEFATDLLSSIQSDGLVDFSEKGHGGNNDEGKESLPSEYASLLDDKTITVRELGQLGINPDDYDLSQWRDA